MQCSAPWEEIWFRILFHITSIRVPFFLLRQMEEGGGRDAGRQTDGEVNTVALYLYRRGDSDLKNKTQKTLFPICHQLPYFIYFPFKLKRVATHTTLMSAPVDPLPFVPCLNTSRTSPSISRACCKPPTDGGRGATWSHWKVLSFLPALRRTLCL